MFVVTPSFKTPCQELRTMDPTERMHQLYKLLIESKYPVHIDRILQELKCSDKTFYRMRRKLEECYHIEIENYDHYYYRFNTSDGETVNFPGLWFSYDEIDALICFSNALNTIQAGILDDIMRPFKEKLYKLLDTHEISEQIWNTRIKNIPIAQRKIIPEVFKKITDAVLHNRRCLITYKKMMSFKSEKRQISPQTILRYRDNWYVDAWCHNREALRTFALSRIESVERLSVESVSVDRTKLDNHYVTSYGIFNGSLVQTAVINFTGVAAQEIEHQEWHPSEKKRWLNDTTLQLTIPYCDATELIMDILRWGDMAEVIEPQPLRDKITGIFRNCVKKYCPVS